MPCRRGRVAAAGPILAPVPHSDAEPPQEEWLPTAGGPSAGDPPPVACRMCGRPLTGRAARRRGLGEGCRAKLAERTAPRPPAREVEQEALPGL